MVGRVSRLSEVWYQQRGLAQGSRFWRVVMVALPAARLAVVVWCAAAALSVITTNPAHACLFGLRGTSPSFSSLSDRSIPDESSSTRSGASTSLNTDGSTSSFSTGGQPSPSGKATRSDSSTPAPDDTTYEVNSVNPSDRNRTHGEWDAYRRAKISRILGEGEGNGRNLPRASEGLIRRDDLGRILGGYGGGGGRGRGGADGYRERMLQRIKQIRGGRGISRSCIFHKCRANNVAPSEEEEQKEEEAF